MLATIVLLSYLTLSATQKVCQGLDANSLGFVGQRTIKQQPEMTVSNDQRMRVVSGDVGSHKR